MGFGQQGTGEYANDNHNGCHVLAADRTSGTVIDR